MVRTSRAIIFIDNKIISIKREKLIDNNTKIYYTLPGGHVEQDESDEEAVLREVEEELGIKVEIKEKIMEMYNKDLDRQEIFYLCKYVSGDIGTGVGPEWSGNNKLYGKYEIVYIQEEDIDKLNILPYEMKSILYKFY